MNVRATMENPPGGKTGRVDAQAVQRLAEYSATPADARFDPMRHASPRPQSQGKRRVEERSPVASIVLHWPETAKLKRDVFDAWHSMSMEVIHREKGSFRTIAVLPHFINWKRGLMFPSNETLARRAGQCSVKTVTRDISDYAAIGIIQIRQGWRLSGSGKWVSTRFLLPSLPTELSASLHVPGWTERSQELEIRMDTRGPCDEGGDEDIRMDTSRPIRMDTSGPTTHEGTLERGAQPK